MAAVGVMGKRTGKHAHMACQRKVQSVRGRCEESAGRVYARNERGKDVPNLVY